MAGRGELGRPLCPASSALHGFMLPHTTQAKGSTAERQVHALLQRSSGAPAQLPRSASSRPQDSFPAGWKPDNSRRPFVPPLQAKHNAIAAVPTLKPVDGSHGPPPPHLHLSAPHPYGPELAAWEAPEWLFTPAVEAPFVSPFTTPFAFVDTQEALQELMQHLESPGVREVAIDLEHHSMHSYQGLTCLVQISTRKKNFVVDALALWPHLHVLNRVTTDPQVLKVLHGCRQDVLWLQRDFGVYLVGVLDTGAAAKELDAPARSLAYLLRTYAGVEAAKQHQMADWRVRDLPDELIAYARDDTHYLLGIADRLRNELLQAAPVCNPDGSPGHQHGRLLRVLSASSALAAQAYEKDRMDEAASTRLARKVLGGGASACTMRVFHALAEWRDRTARGLDVSPHVVLPRRTLAKLARSPPDSVAALLRACRPVPAAIQQASETVQRIIADSVAGRYSIPWHDAVLPPAGHGDAPGVFDGTWSVWSKGIPLIPREGASDAEAAVLKSGGTPIEAPPGAALQSPAVQAAGEGHHPVRVPEGGDDVQLARPASVTSGGAPLDQDKGALPPFHLHPSLGEVGVAPEPCTGFLAGHFVGISQDVLVTAELPQGEAHDVSGAGPVGQVHAVLPQAWVRKVQAGVGPHLPGASPALPRVLTHSLATPDGPTTASTTAAEIAAGLEGKYLHQLLPAAAPPRQAEASGVAATPGAGAQVQAQAQESKHEEGGGVQSLPKSLAEVYDLSMSSRKRHKSKHRRSAAAQPAPGDTPAAAGMPAAERQALVDSVHAQSSKDMTSDAHFLAALGWGDAQAAEAAVPRTEAPHIAKASRAATRKLLGTSKAAGAGGSGTAMNARGIGQVGQQTLASIKPGATSIADISRAQGKRRKGRKAGGSRTVKAASSSTASSKGHAGGKSRSKTAMGALLRD